MFAPWERFPTRVIYREDAQLELSSTDSGTLGERHRASHDADRRPRVQFIFGAFEPQTSVQVHLPDSLRSALAAATHTELARSPPLAGKSVRRVKQSISRTSAVPCTSWPCEARAFTNDSRFRPRVVRPRVHVSYGAAALAPVLGVNTMPQVYRSYFPNGGELPC